MAPSQSGGRIRRRGFGPIHALLVLSLVGVAACSASVTGPTPSGVATPPAASEPSGSQPSGSSPGASPGPSVASSGAPSPTINGQSYRVKSGDTLSGIATRFHRTVGQLLTANPSIVDPNHIRKGQVLIIPPADAPDLPPSIAGIDDPANDMVDLAGNPTAGQAYADILGFSVRLQATDLLMEIRLVGTPPPLDPSVEQLTFTIHLDANGDGEPDFTIVYSNALGGQSGYAASLSNIATGEQFLGAAFPGTVQVSDATVHITVPLSALGTSRSFGLAAEADRRFYPGGPGDSEVEASVDMAPNQQWPHANARWVTVGR